MDAPGHFLVGARGRAGGRRHTSSPTAAAIGMKDVKDQESVQGKERGGASMSFSNFLLVILFLKIAKSDLSNGVKNEGQMTHLF
jgi:hypothetical protein